MTLSDPVLARRQQAIAGLHRFVRQVLRTIVVTDSLSLDVAARVAGLPRLGPSAA